MSEKPRAANESVFSNGLLSTIAFRGCLIGLATLAVFTALMRQTADVDAARTGALVTLIVSQLVHVFECKSEKRSIFKINPFDNPALILAVIFSAAVTALAVYLPAAQLVFTTVPLTAGQFGQSLVYALIVPICSALFMMRPRKKDKAAVVEAA